MSLVSITKCEDYQEELLREALTKTFLNLGGISSLIKPNSKVFLKANLVIKKKPEEAATTNPVFIRVLVKMLEEFGSQVIIGDSPGGPYTVSHLKSVYRICGIEEAIEGTNAKLNFNTDTIVVDNPNGLYIKRVNITKALMDVDAVINLPKLKTHGQMVYTGAVKNMFGAVPGEDKAGYHLRMADYNDFANALIDIYLSVKPTLNIMDAVVGMDREGPTAGRPRKIGLILASSDGFALDIAALRHVNIDTNDAPIIKNAINRGLCDKNPQIIGEISQNEKIRDFEYPKVNSLIDIQFINNNTIKRVLNKIMPRPVFNHSICVGCEECRKCCPASIITMNNHKPVIESDMCIRCFCCAELCTVKAVSIRRLKSFEFILKIAAFFVTLRKDGNQKYKEK